MGRHVAEAVARRLGRSILELGGNNGIIVMDDANPDLAAARRAVRRGGHGGTALHHHAPRCSCSAASRASMTEALAHAYRQVKIGDPLEETTLMGPLVNRRAVDDMMDGIRRIREQGGEILYRRQASSRAASSSRRWCARAPTCRF